MALNPLLKTFAYLLQEKDLDGPVLDLACGKGQNGIFLAEMGIPVILADRSHEALSEARKSAAGRDLKVSFLVVDLETGLNPIAEDHYRAILVFRYLHRPLIPYLRKGIKKRGILIYETFTIEQTRYSPPHNPDHLLKPGELSDWFKDWEVIHSFEGILGDPERSMAQIVCRKPFDRSSSLG